MPATPDARAGDVEDPAVPPVAAGQPGLGHGQPAGKISYLSDPCGRSLSVLFYVFTVLYFVFRCKYTLTGPALEHSIYTKTVVAVEALAALSMIFFSLNRWWRVDHQALAAEAEECREARVIEWTEQVQRTCRQCPPAIPRDVQYLGYEPKGHNIAVGQDLSPTEESGNATAGAAIPRPIYRVHVLVCTYREDYLDTVLPTLEAARQMLNPDGCCYHVYLCDDDPTPDTEVPVCWKAEYCRTYGIGHIRRNGTTARTDRHHSAPPDSNGKSKNVNNALSEIAKTKTGNGGKFDDGDLVLIVDADHRLEPCFLRSTVFYFAVEKGVAMVITPQMYHNVDPAADVFNHINGDYWRLMMKGMEGWGFISCPGTNFLVRATVLDELKATRRRATRQEYIASYTNTEDYALGMEIRGLCSKYRAVFLETPLAEGLAPLSVVSTLKQRRRWTTGHFQVFFWNNPLGSKTLCGMPWWMRLMYSTSVISYTASIVSTFTFTAVPLMSLWVGWFPAYISPIFVPFLLAYIFSGLLLKYSHVKGDVSLYAMWFASCADTLFFFTYLRAIFMCLDWTAPFEATGGPQRPQAPARQNGAARGAPNAGHSRRDSLEDASCWTLIKAMGGHIKTNLQKCCNFVLDILGGCWNVLQGDVGISIFFLLFSAFTLLCAIGKVVLSYDGYKAFGNSPVLISMLWVAYNAQPHVLALAWALLHRWAIPDPKGEWSKRGDSCAKMLLHSICWMAFWVSFVLLVAIAAAVAAVAYNMLAHQKQMEVWCGLFPFYFNNSTGINRAFFSHHKDCPIFELVDISHRQG